MRTAHPFRRLARNTAAQLRRLGADPDRCVGLWCIALALLVPVVLHLDSIST